MVCKYLTKFEQSNVVADATGVIVGMNDGPAGQYLDLAMISAKRPVVTQDNFDFPAPVVDTVRGCQDPSVFRYSHVQSFSPIGQIVPSYLAAVIC